MQEFQQHLDVYLDLRAAMSRRLKPLSPTPDSAELAARQDALAAALRNQRRTARQGDLVPAGAAAAIRDAIQADFRRRPPAARQALFQEVPSNAHPVINRQYPPQQALPTVPPLLLQALPQLPDNLQYRFYGRHVVLLDGDVQIIIDYIPDVLPPH